VEVWMAGETLPLPGGPRGFRLRPRGEGAYNVGDA